MLRVRYVSRNFQALTGHERTAMIVDPGFWHDRIHPEDAQTVREVIAEVLARPDLERRRVTYRVRHRDGHHLEVIDAFRIVRDAHEAPLEIVGAWLGPDPT